MEIWTRTHSVNLDKRIRELAEEIDSLVTKRSHYQTLKSNAHAVQSIIDIYPELMDEIKGES